MKPVAGKEITPVYLHSQTFFGVDPWGAHEFVGELLARGIGQVTLACNGPDWTVSWPERRVPDTLQEAG